MNVYLIPGNGDLRFRFSSRPIQTNLITIDNFGNSIRTKTSRSVYVPNYYSRALLLLLICIPSRAPNRINTLSDKTLATHHADTSLVPEIQAKCSLPLSLILIRKSRPPPSERTGALCIHSRAPGNSFRWMGNQISRFASRLHSSLSPPPRARVELFFLRMRATVK